ncbi:MAG TPA: pirin family protein [Candidatus Binatia bacterium]|nr:pirin family protein [Candidatus Binatia bacterium]
MITRRVAQDRGHAQHGWLDSYHTFSFADYYDPRHIGFRTLRVINEDRVQPGKGFGTHPHRDMEIISYVLEGALAHKDSLGTGSLIAPGEVQRMSAGTGVAHSEFNPSQAEPVHFLQIWILPERAGLPPSYEQRAFPAEEKRRKLRLVASHDGREGSVTIHQEVDLYTALLAPGETVTHRLTPGRHAWVQVARGAITLNDTALSAGDGAAVSEETLLTVTATDPAEVLLFDLP